MMPVDNPDILRLLAQYFDGLYRADPLLLQAVFHEDLTYVNATSGAESVLDLNTYLKVISAREAPDKSGQKRNPEIVQIQQIASGIAFAHVRMSMMGFDYDDALTAIIGDFDRK